MIFSPFERLMAWRYLRSSRREGFVSVIAFFSFIGIMLGVATLIIVMSVMNGFRHELLHRIIGMRGHLWVQSYGKPVKDDPKLVQKVLAVPHTTSCVPMIEQQAVLMAGTQARGVNVQGISLQNLKKRPLLLDGLEGRVDQFKGNSIWVGQRLCEKTGLRLGDSVSLMIPNGTQTAFGTLPRQRSFQITGIFEVGMIEYDQNMVFMPLDAAQSFFNLPGELTHLEVFVKDPDQAHEDALTIYQKLDKKYQVIDWRHGNSTFFQTVQIERNVMFIILTLIILIAAFNVISSLIMLVKNKTRDIAILRTMGASSRSIMKIFFLTGASIGVGGTLLGLILGISFAFNIETIRQWLQSLSGTELFNAEIYFLSQLPSRVDWNEVLAVVSIALVLSFAASLYPSWKASRLDPIEGLRQ